MPHRDVLPENLPVPVVHEPLDGVVTVRLAFGVGTCDEPVTLAGITHLVEHLAVRGALPIAAPLSATTHDRVTVFEVVSTTVADGLAELERIARAIGDLLSVSDDAVAHERKVLEREDGLRHHEQVPSIHTHRFGPAGPGRSDAGAAATAGISADEVQRWVTERFAAENAIVTVTGGDAAPASVHLPLPSGSAAGPIAPWAGPIHGRLLAASPLSGTAVSVLVRSDVALLLDAVLEDELFTALRIEAGLAYSVEGHVLDVDRDRAVVSVAADTDEGDVVAATDRILATLHRIAAEGPSPATVAEIDAARALNELDASARADRIVSEVNWHADTACSTDQRHRVVHSRRVCDARPVRARTGMRCSPSWHPSAPGCAVRNCCSSRTARATG